MNVTLPNGKVIQGVPEGTPKDVIMQKAIAAGLATEADFAPQKTAPTEQQLAGIAQSQSGLDAALISAGKGFADILRGVGLMDEADETERRAFEALKKANPITSTVGEIAGQALPFAAAGGPLVAGVAGTGGRIAASAGLGALEGGLVSKGQGEDVSQGAMTGALFGAGGQAVGEGIDSVRRLYSGVKSPNAALEYAEAKGIPLMTTDVVNPESALGRGVRNIGEEIPVAGTSGARAAQQTARIGEVESLRQLYPEVTDDAIYESFKRSGDRYKQAQSARYESIGNIMGDAEVPMTKTARVISSELDKLKSGGTIKDTETINSLQKVLDDMMSGPQTYKSMRDNRTFVREALKSEKPSTQADRVIERVYQAMTDDISDAVSNAAGPETAAKLKQVDKLFAIEKSVQKKTKLRNVLSKGDVKPEEATKMIFSSDLSDVKQAYSALDNKGRSIARAAIVNKIIERAGDSPEKFISAMDRYDKQFGVFFKGAERKQLEGLKEYLNATRRAATAQLDPQTGRRMIPLVLAGGVGADLAGSGGLTTATFATIGAMARAYESKPVRNAMLRLANTPKGGEAYQKAVNAVNSALVAAQQQGEE